MINIDDDQQVQRNDNNNNNNDNENINDLFYGCTTQQYENYDVVTVDLDDDRDYPIYIGTDFTNEQGNETDVFGSAECVIYVYMRVFVTFIKKNLFCSHPDM